jgi:hypothetical protein
MPAGGSVAVHGNRRAVAEGLLVRVERVLTADEQRRLVQEEQRTQHILAARASQEYHIAEADTAENARQPFAAVFRLDRLVSLLPDERAGLLKRRHTILAAMLKKTPGDVWAARALARQAIADPLTVPDRASLLPILASLTKEADDAASHRLHGGLLIRTGSAKEAVTVLQTAIKNRGPDAPPVEELLLALAHIELKQFAVARKHLQTAVAWMRRGTAQAPLAITPPDPRLMPLDPQTAHDLTALRAEVEKTLAKVKQ